MSRGRGHRAHLRSKKRDRRIKSVRRRRRPNLRSKKRDRRIKEVSHHCRPHSIGGIDGADNRAWVRDDIEDHWHRVVENACVPVIVRFINYNRGFGPRHKIVYTLKEEPIHPQECGLVCPILCNVSKSAQEADMRLQWDAARQEAWRILWELIGGELRRRGRRGEVRAFDVFDFMCAKLFDRDYEIRLVREG